jgi:oxygen-dependent protoporphyrinogen oxidase
MENKVVVVGAGLAGLVCAYKLSVSEACRSGQLSIEVVDSRPQAGGVIESLQVGDCLIESGPDSFITNKPYMLDLCRELGIEKRIISVNKKNRGAMVVHQGKLLPLPQGFIMLAPSQLLPFALSPVLSWGGKLRALCDLFLPARESTAPEESLAQFVRRRFGSEVLERLAQPMVAGVYVGDAETLSSEAVAERFVKMERTAGSVIRGLMAERAGTTTGAGDATRTGIESESNEVATSGARYGLFASFDGGLSVVVQALLDAMGDRVKFRLGQTVNKVDLEKSGQRATLTLSSGETLGCKQVVLTSAAAICARLLQDIPQLAQPLSQISAASSAVINFVFDRKQIRHPLNAFGAVIPESEIKKCRFTIIAFSFASLKYPRAPKDKVILRAFVGGVKGEDVIKLGDDQLIKAALRDLDKLLGINGTPSHQAVHRWPTSMPQYDVGLGKLLNDIDAALANLPNLYLAGNSYRGVGLPDCVNSGCQTAEKLLSKLKLGQLSV